MNIVAKMVKKVNINDVMFRKYRAHKTLFVEQKEDVDGETKREQTLPSFFKSIYNKNLIYAPCVL
jgi:hypothetical protein